MLEHEGTLIRGFGGGTTVRVLAVEVAAIAERTRAAHGLEADAAAMAAEGVVATVLLSAHIKGEERLMLQVQGSEPRIAFVGEIGAEGNVRARLTPADTQRRAGGLMDGVVLVVKSDGVREVYRGHTAMNDETMEAALSHSLSRLEQVDAILKMDVRIGSEGEVEAAAGMLIERLPEHREHPWLTPEAFDAKFGPLRSAPVIETLAEIAAGALLGEELVVMERRALRWRCRCGQDRVEATLGLLGVETLFEMIRDDHGAEVTCHFCNTDYQVTEKRLIEILALLSQSPAT